MDTVITTSGSVITSPNYPNDYQSFKNCEVRVQMMGRIHITFLDFHLETSSSCEKDYLDIYGDQISSSEQIGTRLCGDMTPRPMVSASSSLHFLFLSDNATVGSGFRILVEDSGNNAWIY